MKTNNISYGIAVALNIVIYLALIRTLTEPLIRNVDPYELRILLTSSLFMAVSCLAMTILTILSKTRVNSFIAAATLIVLIVTKLTLLH